MTAQGRPDAIEGRSASQVESTHARRAGERRVQSARPPVLLAFADYYGTLAGARCLGRAGVQVRMAESRILVPGRWSRYVSQTLPCPDAGANPERFVAWLVELGERDPGQVLIATTDDLAWLFALHRERLARHFLLDLPPLETVSSLLNKWRLREACIAVGLDTPETWLPRDDTDLARIARDVHFPLLIKPQTQVFLSPHRKGQVVRSAGVLAALYGEFQASARHAPALLELDPSVARPMLQAFHEGAADGIYNLSGFIDRTGELFVASASRKVLQRPRLTGVGLCFEEDEVVPSLAEKLAALCRSVGYHGVFEAEFLRHGERHLLIDFNPRFYGQMEFDVARGLELPLLTYLAAVGDRAALSRAVEEARRAVSHPGRRVFCNRVQLSIFLSLLWLTGRLSRADARRWRAWLSEHRQDTADAVLSVSDWLPGLVDAVSSLIHHARHPRSTLRAARED